MSIILWSQNQQHKAQGQGHLVDAIIKKFIHVPSLPTPNSNIILWIPQNLLLDLSSFRDLTNLSTQEKGVGTLFFGMSWFFPLNMDISKHPTAFEHVKSSNFNTRPGHHLFFQQWNSEIQPGRVPSSHRPPGNRADGSSSSPEPKNGNM